jgi:hypothetical protein
MLGATVEALAKSHPKLSDAKLAALVLAGDKRYPSLLSRPKLADLLKRHPKLHARLKPARLAGNAETLRKRFKQARHEYQKAWGIMPGSRAF